MPIVYKVNVLHELKERGYSTSRLRKEELLAESVIHHLRTGGSISFASLGRICSLLDLKPGDIIDYVDDPDARAVPAPPIVRTAEEEYIYLYEIWDRQFRKPGDKIESFHKEDFAAFLPVPDDWVSPINK